MTWAIVCVTASFRSSKRCATSGAARITDRTSSAGSLQSIDVADVDIRKGVSDDALEMGATHEGPVRIGGCGESVCARTSVNGQTYPNQQMRCLRKSGRYRP